MDRDEEAGDPTGLFHVVVDAAQAGLRLDRILVNAAGAAGLALSRTRLQGLISEGCVTGDGRTLRDANVRIRVGTGLVVSMPALRPATPLGQALPLTIVFEDDELLILDKPAGLVVHPAAGHEDGTLVNALIAHCGDSLSGIGGVRRPGIVHRLDKDTSGLMVVAKTDRAHAGLGAIFADHGRSGSLVRDYLAFVWGDLRSVGIVDAPLGRDPHNRLKVAIVPAARGRRAITHWRKLRSFAGDATLVQCSLETGRTHQIRVHMASIGHPLIGDDVYGSGFRTKATRLIGPARDATLATRRQALHAATLGFAHPVTGKVMLFRSPLPPDLAALERTLSEQV